jgi:hypothetical protein
LPEGGDGDEGVDNNKVSPEPAANETSRDQIIEKKATDGVDI